MCDNSNIVYYTITGLMLRENKVLRSLGLWKCGLGPEGLFEVFNVLRNNRTLISLDVSENVFDERSIHSLGKSRPVYSGGHSAYNALLSHYLQPCHIIHTYITHINCIKCIFYRDNVEREQCSHNSSN